MIFVKENLVYNLDFFPFLWYIEGMNGLTIKEMAEILGITPDAVQQRLLVAKISPLTKDAVYAESALEVIRKVPGKGRPKKAKPE
jgi:predicted ArsR family transcriptional regulator